MGKIVSLFEKTEVPLPTRFSRLVVQIVGYESTPDPSLLIAEDARVESIPLSPGRTLEFPLGDRQCAGSIDETRHITCGSASVPWCPEHTDTWICARCRGTCLKDVMDCHDPHVVYLAIVAPDAIKVGVTKAHRIERRLHEQGADRGVTIHEVANGRIAREIEADIANTHPERIRTSQKITGLSHRIDDTAWEDILERYEPIDTYHPEYDLDLDEQPIHETVAWGTVRGVKGRLLVLDAGGSTYVTDVRDLVGYHIAPDMSDHSLQSGLAAFE